MSRDESLFLSDILTSCEKIARYVAGVSYDQFCADAKTRDAVVFNVHTIGEAVKNLSEET